MKIKSFLFCLIFLPCMLFIGCEKSELALDNNDSHLNELLSQYPSEVTVENYKLFVDAPAEVLAYLQAKEGKLPKRASTTIRVDESTKAEILKSWGDRHSTTANRMTCNSDFITGIVPNESFYPSAWVGGMYADLNFDGIVDLFDGIIMAQILVNFDNNNDGAITGWSETMNGTPTNDYDGNGLINSDDNWAAAMFTWQLSDIAGLVWSFDGDDIGCVFQAL